MNLNAKKVLKGLYNQPYVQFQTDVFRAEKKRNTPPKMKNYNGEIIQGEIPPWANLPYKNPDNDHMVEKYKSLTNINNKKSNNNKYKK